MVNDEVERNEEKKVRDKAYIGGWMTSETQIGGMTLKSGDIIELGVGRKTITGIFKGYDRILFSFYILDVESGEEMVIPYKTVKYIRKRKQQT